MEDRKQELQMQLRALPRSNKRRVIIHVLPSSIHQRSTPPLPNSPAISDCTCVGTKQFLWHLGPHCQLRILKVGGEGQAMWTYREVVGLLPGKADQSSLGTEC